MQTTFNEWYGYITRGTRIAIKRHNVSPADFEALLRELDLMDLYFKPVSDEDYRDIIAFILSRSKNGSYRMTSF